jgi:hypothetical protein
MPPRVHCDGTIRRGDASHLMRVLHPELLLRFAGLSTREETLATQRLFVNVDRHTRECVGRLCYPLISAAFRAR